MITKYIASQIMGYIILFMSIYMLAKGILSDMGIVEGYTQEQITTFAWGSIIICYLLAWKVYFCVPKEE